MYQGPRSKGSWRALAAPIIISKTLYFLKKKKKKKKMFLITAWYCFDTCTVSSIHCCVKKTDKMETNEMTPFGARY